MSLGADRCLRRSVLVEQLVEAWEIDHRSAMLACDVDELSDECVELAKLLKSNWRAIRDRFFTPGPGDLAEIGQVIENAFERSSRVIRKVLALADELVAQGYSIRKRAEVRASLEFIEKASAEANEMWPADDGTADQARIDYQNGDYRPISELLAELRQ